MPPPSRTFYADEHSSVASGLRLSELTGIVEDLISSSFTRPLWVVAEVSGMQVNRSSGHCYMDLIEKNDQGKIVASIRAMIWSSQHRLISEKFYEETGIELSEGLELLLMVYVRYSPVYGLSLNIVGVDATYSLGAMRKQREATIAALKASGIWDMNRALPLSPLPRKIAVISSATAAGWGDFHNQLTRNDYNIRFAATLFPAIMQGNEAPASIISALDAVMDSGQEYDAVVIIRGGGSRLDLLAFDNATLCEHVAQYPYPIISGIGHDRDLSILDMVAHTALKTPTAVATFLIDKNLCYISAVSSAEERLVRLMGGQKQLLESRLRVLMHKQRQLLYLRTSEIEQRVGAHYLRLQRFWALLTARTESRIASDTARLKRSIASWEPLQRQKLSSLEERLRLLSPDRILSSGYALFVGSDGKSIRSASQTHPGEDVKILLGDGAVSATVTGVEKREEEYND